MRLCEVAGCTRTAVGLVRVQLEGWRVPESRRVCTHHHREMTREEAMGESKEACSACERKVGIKAKGLCSRCYEAQRRAKQSSVVSIQQLNEVREERDAYAAKVANLTGHLRNTTLAHQSAEDRLQAVLEELRLVKQQQLEVEQALRAVLLEVDEWHTDAMVSDMNALQVVAALSKRHSDRERYKTDSQEARKALQDALTRQGILEEELSEFKDDTGVALDLLRMAHSQVSSWESRSGRVVSLLIDQSMRALEGER